MSNLIPERRTDKNGVTRTRWVKPTGDSQKPNLPVPSLPPVGKEYRHLIRQVMSQLSQDEKTPEHMDPKVIKNRLMRLPRHTLDYISSTRDQWMSNPYLDRILISTLHNEVSPVVIDDIAYLYLNMSYDISGYESWSLRGFEGEMIISDALRGIHAAQLDGVDYDFRSDTPLRLRDDDMGSKVLAILNVMNVLLDEFSDEARVQHDDKEFTDIITDRVLAQLVVDKHNRNEELVELMDARKTADPMVLTSIMDADANAMRDGFL
jgi:hypothetical protein